MPRQKVDHALAEGVVAIPRDHVRSASDVGELGQSTVTSSERVLGVTAASLRVNGVAASSVSGAGGGPYLFQGFIAPSDGPAVVELAAGQIVQVDVAEEGSELPFKFTGVAKADVAELEPAAEGDQG